MVSDKFRQPKSGHYLPVLLWTCQPIKVSNLVIKAPKLSNVDGVRNEFRVRCKLGYGVDCNVLAALREKEIRQLIQVDEVGERWTLDLVDVCVWIILTDEVLYQTRVICNCVSELEKSALPQRLAPMNPYLP